MNPNLFLVARISPSDHDDVAWLAGEGPPYVQEDPLDFAMGEEIQELFRLYENVYRPLDPLNVLTPEQLIEFNRWILIIDEKEKIVGFVALKTTAAGIKLCLTATDGSRSAKSTVKSLNRNGLNIPGVYAEVSGKLEKVVIDHVPVVDQVLVEQVLMKPVKPDKDGRHYSREIKNIGRKRKILVGRPFL